MARCEGGPGVKGLLNTMRTTQEMNRAFFSRTVRFQSLPEGWCRPLCGGRSSSFVCSIRCVLLRLLCGITTPTNVQPENTVPSRLHHERSPIRRRSQEIKDIVEIGTIDTVQCRSIEAILRHSTVRYISQCEWCVEDAKRRLGMCSGLYEHPQTCGCSVRASSLQFSCRTWNS